MQDTTQSQGNPSLNTSALAGNTNIQSLLNQTLNKSDAFTMRLASTKQSLATDEEFKFKARQTSYKKQNEKLWTLIDRYKAKKIIDKEASDNRA